MYRFAMLMLAAGTPLLAQLSPGRWRTDLSKRSVNFSEIKQGGPPKDGIPAIDHPRFVDIAEAARWLNAKEAILVVRQGGEARGYPLQILIWHELVNDQVADLPLLVSYCPLCNSAIVFDRRLNGGVYEFGVSGMLRSSDMIMYDRQTDSLWQQITGEAIVGTLTGRQLKPVASQTVSFEVFAQTFPNGKVLSRETGYRRPYGDSPYPGYEFGNRLMAPVDARRPKQLALLERIVTVGDGAKYKAYPFALLRRRGVVEDKIGDLRLVVFFQEGTLTPLDRRRIADSKDVGAAVVFSPELGGTTLKFERKDGKFVDQQTGSSWNLLGIATEGPLAGKRLVPLQHGIYFAFAWLAFRPDTEVAGISDR